MLTAALILAWQTQGRPPKALLFPPLPAGVSTEVSSRVYAVEEQIAAGNKALAKKLLKALPSQRIKVYWDDDGLSRNERNEYEKSRDDAFHFLQAGMALGLDLAEDEKHADVKIGFVSSLPPRNGKKSTVVTFYHDEPNRAPYEIVLSSHRLKGGLDSRSSVMSDIAYGLASYMGSSALPFPGSATYREGVQTTLILRGNLKEQVIMTNTTIVADFLRTAVNLKGPFVAGRPDMYMTPMRWQDQATTVQGSPYSFQFQITNNGTSALIARLFPDCNCFAVDGALNIPPGDTRVVKVGMDTSLYAGPVHKQLFLLSNDPSRPVITIPVDVKVSPRYRFLLPDGKVAVVEGDEAEFKVILVTPGDSLKPKAVRVQGIPGEATIEPWTGVARDPLLEERPSAKSGYLIKVRVPENLKEGQTPFTLLVDTDDPGFKQLHETLLAQRGIAAMPASLYLGELSLASSAQVKLVRPNHPFRILSVRCTNPHFKVVTSKTSGTELLLTVKYDGAGGSGQLACKLLVKTDEPRQSLITIPVTGSIR